MRLLFVMNTPGFLRYYDETLAALAQRGHDVLLAFNDPDARAEATSAIEGRCAVLGAAPERGDRYAAVAGDLRALADFARYLHPRFAQAQWLRDRRRVRVLQTPVAGRLLGERDQLPAPLATAVVRGLLALEHALPSAPDVEAHLRALAVDAVLVTPLVTGGSGQTDYVKSARALGLPCALCVASWDNLTNKGLVREVPDRVMVWNEPQAREAVELHGVARDRVVITGAQPFDRWFGRAPTADRDAFCARVGLDPERPYVLFAGSTSNIADPSAEDRFVRRWAEAVRAARPEVGILVRPHPDRRGAWEGIDLDGLDRAVVWPRERPSSVTPAARSEYFDSLFHAAAVVGINTSAMVEAAVIGRPVLTVREPEFAQAHEGTLHFAHLRDVVLVGDGLGEHVRELTGALADPGAAAGRNRRFVETFIRPQGADRAANPRLVEAIEALPAVRVTRRRPAPWRPVLRGALRLAAARRARAAAPPRGGPVAVLSRALAAVAGAARLRGVERQARDHAAHRQALAVKDRRARDKARRAEHRERSRILKRH